MTDAFLDSLRADWQARPAQPDAIEAAFARRRLWGRLSLVGSALGVVLVAMGFIGLAMLALRERDLAQLIAALAFAAALPLLMLGLVEQARDMKFIARMNPEDTLHLMRQHAVSSLRRLRGALACAAILAVAAVALLVATVVGATDFSTGAFAMALWLFTALLVWIWQHWRADRLRREIGRCEQMIAEFEVSS